jgi:hypothetical protein
MARSGDGEACQRCAAGDEQPCPARAHLTAIARDPEGVRRALEAKPG